MGDSWGSEMELEFLFGVVDKPALDTETQRCEILFEADWIGLD